MLCFVDFFTLLFFSPEASVKKEPEPVTISQTITVVMKIWHAVVTEVLSQSRNFSVLFMRHIKRSVLLYRFLALAVFSFYVIYLFSNSHGVFLFWIWNVAFCFGWLLEVLLENTLCC